MRPLKVALPYTGDKVLYISYGFETTQYTRYTDAAKLHVRNLDCVQQQLSLREDVEHGVGDRVRCGKRKHSFWEYPVGDLLSYVCEPRPWANTNVARTHNAKAFDLHIIMNRAIILKWKPD